MVQTRRSRRASPVKDTTKNASPPDKPRRSVKKNDKVTPKSKGKVDEASDDTIIQELPKQKTCSVIDTDTKKTKKISAKKKSSPEKSQLTVKAADLKGNNDEQQKSNKKHEKPMQPKTKSKPKKSKGKGSSNMLTKLIPGYTAPMRLSSSSSSSTINKPSDCLEALRKKGLGSGGGKQPMFSFQSTANRQKIQALTNAGSSSSVSTNFKSGNKTRRRPVATDAGAQWFGMKATPMTEELKRDLQVIRNRNYLDPKRFYKSSDRTTPFVQAGTVIEGSAEFYSARLSKKERRTNLTEEIMADPDSSNYAKNKYKRMQQEKTNRYMKRTKKQRR